MKSILSRFKVAASLLLLYSSISLNAQQADFKNHSVFNFFNGYQENVIDTAGNILFEEGWSYIIPLPDCNKYLGIRMLPDAKEGHVPTFDYVPAEYALLSLDGSKTVLDYKAVSNCYWGQAPFSVLTEEGWGLIDCDNKWIIKPFAEKEIIISGESLQKLNAIRTELKHGAKRKVLHDMKVKIGFYELYRY